MKTDNVYIGQLVYSTKIKYEGNLEDYFLGPGIRQKVCYDKVKIIVLKKVDDFGFIKAIDLKAKKKYLCELPVETGVLYVSPSTLIHFEALYPDAPRNLPKKKILEMGNCAIEEINKQLKKRKK